MTMKIKSHQTVKVYTTTLRSNATHFLSSALIIRHKGCAFIYECCWNAFLQLMVYLTLLFKAVQNF